MARTGSGVTVELFNDPEAQNLNDFRLIRWECREALAEGREPYGRPADEVAWNGQPLREYWAGMTTADLIDHADDYFEQTLEAKRRKDRRGELNRA